jgi:uncharacterized protein (TIGR03435 family)
MHSFAPSKTHCTIMKKIALLLLLLTTIGASAQNYMLKPGDRFPDLVIRPIINAPVKEVFLNKATTLPKLTILNFWGTWCSPCIPEMDALAKLQQTYADKIQVIAVSDESTERLRKYVIKKPSAIWLASDTSSLLYEMFNLANVGQCAVINQQHKIVALLNTDSVNAKTIDRLLKGEKVPYSGKVTDQLSKTEKDPFGIDTLQQSSFSIRTYMKGQQSMGQVPTRGIFAGRRVSYFNINLTTLYRTAYDIHTMKQMDIQFDKKLYDDFNDKSQLYCFDLLVKPQQKDSLYLIMQKKLQENLPVKARTEQRDMDVYILKVKEGGAATFLQSKLSKMSYGFDGQGVTLSDFGSIYLSNELQLPVIDETGLAGRYDIKTNVEMRTKEGIMKSITDLGLTVEKQQRKMKVVVLYKGE